MITRNPNDPGQPRMPSTGGAAENPQLIEDYVRTFSIYHGTEFLNAQQRIRGVMREFLVLGFLAETGLMPTKTMLMERREDNRTYWSYHPVTPLDNLAAAEQRMLKTKITQLQDDLADARDEIAMLKARR